MSARRAVRWATHLRRTTTHTAWLPEIDGLRFIAILSVLFFHLQGQIDQRYAVAVAPPMTWLVRIFGFGNRGVPLFFVISGFILALPFARAHLFAGPAPLLRRYYLRRVTRLEPPYLVNLILVTAALALADHSPWRLLLPHLAASICYLHYAIFHTPSSINSVAWSMEVEVQFYLVAPLLAMVFTLRRPAVRRTVLIAGMLASALLQSVFGWSQYALAGDLQYFLAGLLLADFYLAGEVPSPDHRKPPRKSALVAWDLVSLFGWPAFFLLGNRFAGVWLPALTLLLCVAAMRGRLTARILRTPAIAIAGGMCYTIYLWHAPIFTFVDRALRVHAAWLPATYLWLFFLEAAVKIAAVALVCLPLFIFIERPCMDPQWPQKLVARLRRRHTPASALVSN